MTAPPARSGFGMSQRVPSSPDEVGDEGTVPPETPELAADAKVDLHEVFEQSGIQRILDDLDSQLIGLSAVKDRIREIASLLLVDRTRERFGISTPRPNLHMSFTGSPGTGKTTVAVRMAELLKQLGYLRKGHLVTVTRDDLVGEYVGHTAPKTREVLKRAMGGVLFIDEAYYLYRAENERDYGQESIEILLQVMENNRDDLVVILAGYEDRMDTFFHSNPGMSSRIAHHLTFADYSQDELEAISDIMISDLGYRFSESGRVAVAAYLGRRMAQPRFANARSVRNAVERARLRQAKRLMAEGVVGRDELVTIEAPDILASRVFRSLPDGDASAPR
jgi:probable Rubsico expression protein CbbX